MRRVPLVVGLCILAFGFNATRATAESPFSFAGALTHDVGGSPRGLATADLDGDGHLDIVAACDALGGVSVLRGLGTGIFTSRIDLATGASPFSVAVSDVNGDGRRDVLVANATSNTVAMLLANSSGGFQAKVDVAVGNTPELVLCGDLNEDGKQDLLFANYSNNTLSVMLGFGNGSFGAKADYVTGSAPRAGVLADINADGKLDVVLANSGSGGVSVFLGTGTGTFAPRIDVAVGATPEGVTVADLNGDGFQDIAVANYSSNDVSVLLGDGIGGFVLEATIPVGNAPWSICALDVDTDGKMDLAVGNFGSGTLTVLRGNGTGQFPPAGTLTISSNSPLSLLTADFNEDGRPDLAATNYSNNAFVSVLNTTPPGGAPNTVELVSDVNPSRYGQPIGLTATLSPLGTTGTVRFFDSGTLLGTAPVINGAAALSVASLLHGTHSLYARHVANLEYGESLSPGIVQFVLRGVASIAVSARSLQVAEHEVISLDAECIAVSPSAGVPAGHVQFFVDGQALGDTVAVSSGRARSPETSSLLPGAHEVIAAYMPDDTVRFEPAVSMPIQLVVQRSAPEIVTVRDVPNDQGGRVFVNWHCVLDKPGVRVVTGYRVWRRVPPAMSAGQRGADQLLRVVASDSSGSETFWEAIANLPAAQLVSYGFTAPTTQDSIQGANPFSAFFVQALTADPFVSFISSPDSGYSVDNLSPPAPTPFIAKYSGTDVALHWLPSRVADFAEFRLYRGGSINFVPGHSNLIFAGRDTGLVDRAGLGGFYKLAAVDVHGNVGRFAMVSPTSPTATLASLVSSEWTGEAASLVWYGAGLPGLRANVYRSDDGTSWSILTQIVADEEGFVRYLDATVLPRHRYSYRLGILDEDTEQFAGITTLEIPGGRLAIRAIAGNPVRGDRLNFVASLPGLGPVNARVLDLAGRVVREQSLEADLSGQLSLSLSEGTRLRPGVYLLEVQQAGDRAVTRFVYLR